MLATRIDGRLARGFGWVLALLVSGTAGVRAQGAAGADAQPLAQPQPHAQTQTEAEDLATADLLDRIREFESGFDEANRLSGVLLVARGDSVVFQHAFGEADPATGEAMRVDAACPIASITKIFTLTATFQLVLERKLALDEPLSRWLPDFPDAEQITVMELLNHRAGIPHRVATPEEEKGHHTAGDVASWAARHPLAFAPGSQSSYSTAGFGVLARVLELVDGRPYHEILAQRVFGPAGMEASYDLTDPDPHVHLQAFLPLEGRLVPAPARDLSYLAGGGSSVCTAADLLRFVRALEAEGVGGVRMEHLVPSGAARWTGASNGYFSSVAVYPDEDLTLVWVGNTWGAAATALWPELYALVHGEPPVPPVVPARVPGAPVEALAALAGEYRVRPGAVSVVALDGEHLRLDDNYLVPVGPDRFWVPGQAQAVHFVRDADGAGVALERGEGADVTRQERF